MTNLFEGAARQELQERLDSLRPESKAQWGTMTADQMLWHCNRFMAYIRGEYTVPYRGNWFMKLFIKPMGLGKMPYPKAKGDTMPEFKASAHYDVEEEKKALRGHIDWFSTDEIKTHSWPAHPLFGTFTAGEWARIAYKHTDHHFRQFGV